MQSARIKFLTERRPALFIGRSADPLHHLDHACHVALGVDSVGDFGARVPEGQLGGLEAELAADQGPGGVPELVRMPAVLFPPLAQLFPLRVREPGEERLLRLPPAGREHEES